MADEGIKDDKDDVEGHRPILKTPETEDDVEGHRPILKTPEGEGLDRG